MATILIVDDSSVVQDYLTFRLSRAGHTVLTASDASAALALLRDGAVPELILSDVEMPYMNGFDFARQLPTVLDQPVPLIFMSADDPRLPPDVTSVGILLKPFDHRELLAMVDRVVRGPEAS